MKHCQNKYSNSNIQIQKFRAGLGEYKLAATLFKFWDALPSVLLPFVRALAPVFRIWALKYPSLSFNGILDKTAKRLS